MQDGSKVVAQSLMINLSTNNGEKAGFSKPGKKTTVVSTDQSAPQPPRQQQPQPPKSGGGGAKAAASSPPSSADGIIIDRIRGLIRPSPIVCQMRYLFGNAIVNQPASFTTIYKKLRKSLLLVESTIIVVFDSQLLLSLVDSFLLDGMDNVRIVTYHDLLCELAPIGPITPACKRIIVAQPLREATPHTFLSEDEVIPNVKTFPPFNASGTLSSEYWSVLCSLAQDYVLASSISDTKLLDELVNRRGGAAQ